MLTEWEERIAIELFGAIPAGRIFGMQVFVDPLMPSDSIHFVDPVTGRRTEFSLPEPPD